MCSRDMFHLVATVVNQSPSRLYRKPPPRGPYGMSTPLLPFEDEMIIRASSIEAWFPTDGLLGSHWVLRTLI
jgi:hypothetical protein